MMSQLPQRCERFSRRSSGSLRSVGMCRESKFSIPSGGQQFVATKLPLGQVTARAAGILIEDDRQQRAAVVLKDVRYRFFAMLEYLPPSQRPARAYRPLPQSLWDREEAQLHPAPSLEEADQVTNETAGKYLAIFERRARKGQCFLQPYLGCREFSCFFRLVDDPDGERQHHPPIAESRDLGIMLYDLDYSNPENPEPLFFRARMEQGTIAIPQFNSTEILR